MFQFSCDNALLLILLPTRLNKVDEKNLWIWREYKGSLKLWTNMERSLKSFSTLLRLYALFGDPWSSASKYWSLEQCVVDADMSRRLQVLGPMRSIHFWTHINSLPRIFLFSNSTIPCSRPILGWPAFWQLYMKISWNSIKPLWEFSSGQVRPFLWPLSASRSNTGFSMEAIIQICMERFQDSVSAHLGWPCKPILGSSVPAYTWTTLFTNGWNTFFEISPEFRNI